MSSHRKHGRARGAPARYPHHPSELDLFESALRDHAGRRPAGPDHKTLQLCRQVQRALLLSLADEPDATVDAVEPMGSSAAQLLVRVTVPSAADPLAVVARLNGRGPSLRAAVAAAITRKRVPTLTFLAVPEVARV